MVTWQNRRVVDVPLTAAFEPAQRVAADERDELELALPTADKKDRGSSVATGLGFDFILPDN